MKESSITIPERFNDAVFDWDYGTYLFLGGYGSGKSYNGAALKIVLKLLTEKRTCLVVRQVFTSIRHSCYEVLCEVIARLGLLTSSHKQLDRMTKVYHYENRLEFSFPNGSRIISAGLDNVERLKSVTGVSIIWIEEPTEISYATYKELVGRLRSPQKTHMILSFNPVGKESWLYTHFFRRRDETNPAKEVVVLDERLLYMKRTIVKNDVYYHHSTCDDNPFLSSDYIANLEKIKEYDTKLYSVARLGQFGVSSNRVFPQVEKATNPKEFVARLKALPKYMHFFGFDFGFEESFNALVFMAVDLEKRELLIYDEDYVNHITDPDFAKRPKMQKLKQWQQTRIQKRERFNYIVGDSQESKAIAFYQSQGFKMRRCVNKQNNSRLQNTRKIKMFKRIIISPTCKNTWIELSQLTYAQDKNGELIHDHFNIDPHTLSAIWYGLDLLILTDPKNYNNNSVSGYIADNTRGVITQNKYNDKLYDYLGGA